MTLDELKRQVASLGEPAAAIAEAKALNPTHAAIGVHGLDGYTNQEIIKDRTRKSERSVCHSLLLQGHAGVGKATHF